jgi:glycine/D-amino acid oxidase-like deaminating enzyme
MRLDETQMSKKVRMTNDGVRGRHSGFATRPLLAIWLSAFAVFLAAGCSSSKIAPVSGRVTLNGKPLAGVHIGFQPIGKPGELNPGGGSYAITDADGQFRLLLVDGEQPGAVIGKHRVEITGRSEVPANIDPPKRPPPKVFVPAKYSHNSELTFDVPPGGTSAANFELKSQ